MVVGRRRCLPNANVVDLRALNEAGRAEATISPHDQPRYQLGLLGVFKYFNFFAESLSSALTDFGIQSDALHLNIVLPVGVSFYTFQSLSYTIDIYRKQFKPTDRFFDFALFVAYFPQLQAGPIERARHLIPQLANPRHINLAQTSRGLFLIVVGFFKKIAIADGVSSVVDQIFGSSGRITWIDVVAGSVFSLSRFTVTFRAIPTLRAEYRNCSASI